MLQLEKTIFILVVVFSGSYVVSLIRWTYFRYTYENVSKFHNSRHASDTKFVLYWTPFWKQKDYYLGYGFNPFKNCDYKNCYATENRTLMPLEKIDALIFHAFRMKRYGVPWIRTPHQRYIFMNIEAPTYVCPKLKKYESYFNWTMTYRFDSDIIRRHGYINKRKTDYIMPTKEFLKKKTKLAAWFVSHCRTPSKREILTKNIQKYIPVDIYGSCGNFSCKRKPNNRKLSSAKCYKMVERKYKFYFSFENSYCKDYSTEKLYNILEKDIVPVVYGAGDYKLSAPPNSVINVEDFKTVEEFANYLRYLDDNVEEYLKYFEWKKEYSITTSQLSAACQICQKLHEPFKKSVYYDLHGWWWGENKSICKKDKALPNIVSDLL